MEVVCGNGNGNRATHASPLQESGYGGESYLQQSNEPAPPLVLIQGDPPRSLQIIFNHFGYLGAECLTIDNYPQFVISLETPMVEICRAEDTPVIIDEHHFCVENFLLTLEDLDAVREEMVEVPPAEEPDERDVADSRQDKLDLYPAAGRPEERPDEPRSRQEIGGHDPDATGGPGDGQAEGPPDGGTVGVGTAADDADRRVTLSG